MRNVSFVNMPRMFQERAAGERTSQKAALMLSSVNAGCRKTKTEFESANTLHNNWQNYVNKHDVNEDIKALYKLLSTSSHIARTEEEVLDAVYDSTLAVLDSTPQLDAEQKTRIQYLTYNLCTCEACQTIYGAHTNKKGQIRISKKYFHETLTQEAATPTALLELMYTIAHQILHALFPEHDEKAINEKAEQMWRSGMNELLKNKQQWVD